MPRPGTVKVLDPPTMLTHYAFLGCVAIFLAWDTPPRKHLARASGQKSTGFLGLLAVVVLPWRAWPTSGMKNPLDPWGFPPSGGDGLGVAPAVLDPVNAKAAKRGALVESPRF